MKLYLLICVLLYSVADTAVAQTYADHISRHYSGLVRRLERTGFSGPIAQEIAQFALVRQAHEDGLGRKPEYSIPGIGPGLWNSAILKKMVGLDAPHVQIRRTTDSQGLPFYVLLGAGANEVGATVIGHLFDYFIVNFSQFSDPDKQCWDQSKKYSCLIHGNSISAESLEHFQHLKDERRRLLSRCNRAFGPGADIVEAEVKRHWNIFENTLNPCKAVVD